MFEDEKIIRIYSFNLSILTIKRQMRSILTKPVNPLDLLKYPTVQGGGGGKKSQEIFAEIFVLFLVLEFFCKCLLFLQINNLNSKIQDEYFSLKLQVC